MSLYKKERIPDSIKNKVWLKYAKYIHDIRFSQCCTCENLVMIPESIRKYHNINYDILNIYVNEKIKGVSGTAEFGHIISEKNGGSIDENNLIVQCKYCNTTQGSKNIDFKLINSCDVVMIDKIYDLDIEMGCYSEKCDFILSNGEICKNNCLFNRNKCYIHLIK